MKGTPRKEAGVVGLYLEILREADESLRREHKWLLDNERLIRSLVDGTFSGAATQARAQATRVREHLMAWGRELAWFKVAGTGIISFADVCDAVDALPQVGLEAREKLFELPIHPEVIYKATKKYRARRKRSRRARS